jgi:hypothetical protein
MRPERTQLSNTDIDFMNFHFCDFNHDDAGRATLNDMFCWFEAGLLELGHSVTRGQVVEKYSLNVLWEHFPRHPWLGRFLRKNNISYGIVATEIPTRTGTFNGRRDGEWLLRYKSFADVAKSAKFIWSMTKESVAFYSKYATTCYIELGYSSRLLPSRWEICNSPDFDFSFYGLRNAHRVSLFERLEKRFNICWPEKVLDRDLYSFITSSRYSLNFLQDSRWPVPSPTKVGRSLHASRQVVSEYCVAPTSQSRYIVFPPSSECDFVDFCLQLDKERYLESGRLSMEAYREEMPMKEIMESVLDSTIGHSSLIPSYPGC